MYLSALNKRSDWFCLVLIAFDRWFTAVYRQRQTRNLRCVRETARSLRCRFKIQCLEIRNYKYSGIARSSLWCTAFLDYFSVWYERSVKRCKQYLKKTFRSNSQSWQNSTGAFSAVPWSQRLCESVRYDSHRVTDLAYHTFCSLDARTRTCVQKPTKWC